MTMEMQNINLLTCRHKCLCSLCRKPINNGERFIDIKIGVQKIIILHINCGLELGAELTKINPLESLVIDRASSRRI